MIGEFKTQKGWRIFIYIAAPLLIAGSASVTFVPLNSQTFTWGAFLILFPISLGGVLLFTYALGETIKGRLIIGNGYVSRAGIFGTRTLEFAEIKGFRVDDNYIHIVANSPGKKSLKMTVYMERYGDVVSWLNDNFLELDSHETREEVKQILADGEFGPTLQSREYKLSEARRLAKYVNIAGVGAGIWLWFYPTPYEISVLVAIVLPFIIIAAIYLHRGLIIFNEKKNSAYPSIAYGLMGPSLGLMVRALYDYELLEYSSLWILIGPLAVILSAMIIVGTKELKKLVDYLALIGLIGLTVAYSYGTCTILNCLFDKSQPEAFTTEVVGKEMSSGKTTTYYLVLNPWGPRTKPEKVSVTQNEYETTDNGHTVEVHLKRGFLGMSWFYVLTE